MLVRLSHVRLANMFPNFSATACHDTTTVGNPGINAKDYSRKFPE